jgi:hypothetical protein
VSPSVSQMSRGGSSGRANFISSGTSHQDGTLAFGDVRRNTTDEFLSLGFWNCGGFPTDNSNAKNKMFIELIRQNNFDVFGFSEVNVHWKALPARSRLPERTIGWFESLHRTTTYLEECQTWTPGTAYQVGGVTQWSIDKVAHRVFESGQDNSGLGRWVWTRYQGTGGRMLRVVTAYRCVKNTTGATSVWSQQTLFLNSLGIDDDPRERFIDDLHAEIIKWIELGDLLVIGLDLNESVVSSRFSQLLLQEGLVEANLNRHGTPLPPTYARGQECIDGIYVSPVFLDCSCGYLPILGDHRVVWIDVPFSSIFGHGNTSRQPEARRLKLLDPRVVMRYQSLLLCFYEQRNLQHHLNQLFETVQSPPSARDVHKYNSLDAIRVEGMRHAEAKCRKLHMGAVPFTPEYSKISKQLLFWKLVCRIKSGKSVDSRYFSRQLRYMDLTSQDIRLLTLDAVQARVRSSYRLLNSYGKQASVKRQSWLEEVSTARAELGDISAEQECKSLLQREQQRRCARIIRAVFNDGHRTGLTRIQHWVTPHSLVDVTTQTEMEMLLQEELSVRFNQAASTPFLREPLYSSVGAIGTTEKAIDILRGSYDIPVSVDTWTGQLIQHLQYIPDATTIQNEFMDTTVADYSIGWSKMKERTSPGYSKLSFAQFKAAALHPELASVDYQFSNIPYRTGLSPSRWQHGVDVMLQKQTGNFQPAKLRAILLFEPDFNQNNKLLGRTVMKYAEQYQGLAIEQFGSRKQMSAIDQSLNKTLTFDLWRQFKIPGALCSNDAKSCYDRIVHSVASLALQRLGVPVSPIISMFSTIQSLKHHIRTIHGVSSAYGVDNGTSIPIQGVGQGNGAGPQIWAAISSVVLNMLRSEGCGAFFTSAISGEQLEFVGYAFVDDTDLVVSAEGADRHGVVRDIQQALTAWEGGISATGGALVPEKSHWYLVDFQWQNGKATYKSIQECPADIRVKDTSGQVHVLRRLEPGQAERTLGVRVAPDGNMKEQYLFLLHTAQTWSNKLCSGFLSRGLVSQALLTTVMKTLMYCLPATTFSQHQCNEIMKPLLQLVLPRLGCVRTLPRALVYAPKEFFGLSIPNLYWEQGIAHVDRLIRYGQSNHLTGQLLRQSLEILQVELGMSESALTVNFGQFGHLVSPTWLTSTWEFISHFNISFKVHIAPFILAREGDGCLMDLFVQKGYRKQHLALLNRCRIFLQVVRISDIVTGCGKFISRTAMDGRYDATFPRDLRWPVQGELPAAAWTIWRQALSSLCETSNTLSRPLGCWLQSSKRRFFYHELEERIYEFDSRYWWYYARSSRRSTRSEASRFTARQRYRDGIPQRLRPATVEVSPTYCWLTGFAASVTEDVLPDLNFVEYLKQRLPVDTHWATKHVSVGGTWRDILTSFQTNAGTLIAVSDGSYKAGYGTASWIICDPTDETTFIAGKAIAPGTIEQQSAFRSELVGLYGIALFLYAMQEYVGVSTCSVTIGCDGLSALNRVKYLISNVNPNSSNFDLVFATRWLFLQRTTTPAFQHVKGHQDEHMDLDIWARLNIKMDASAKSYLVEEVLVQKLPPVYRIFGEPWPILLAGVKQISDLRKNLLYFIGKQTAEPFWKKRKSISHGTQLEVDWTHMGYAMRSIPLARQTWVTKHSSGFFSCGKMQKRWKFKDTDICPICGSFIETAQHMFQCRDTRVTTMWTRKLRELQIWLLERSTDPILVTLLCRYLDGWRDGTDLTPLVGNTSLIATQTTVGWDSLLHGFIAVNWRESQEAYVQRLQKKISIRRWTISFIKKMWDTSWDFWEHRNGIVHDKLSGALTLQINADICRQFEMGSWGVLASAVPLFRQGLDKVLQSPLEVKQVWLNRIQQGRKRFQDTGGFQSMRNVMRRWLSSVPTRAPET